MLRIAAGLLAVGGLALGAVSITSAFETVGRQTLEPVSAAEDRCDDIDPGDIVGSQRWRECVEHEMRESPLAAAAPDIARGIAFCAVGVVGVLLVFMGRSTRRPGPHTPGVEAFRGQG